jgi:hypothetical protein
MSQLQIRNDLLAQAISTIKTGLGLDLAYENKDFNPDGLDAWCSFHFVPATSESLGKGGSSCDDERGFIQISAHVKTNALDYDNHQLAIIDEVKKSFYNSATIGSTTILEVTTNNGYIVDSFYRRDITINYTSYQQRG